MKALVLAAILHLMPEPAPHWDESPSDYRERVERIAEAVAAEATSRRLAFAAVVTMWYEARFSPAVHAGVVRGDKGRAICLGQHHRNGRTEEEWEALAGTGLEATRRCVRATIEGLARADRFCRARHGPSAGIAPVFALYGSGSTCDPRRTRNPRDFRRRVALYARLTARF